MKKGWLLAIVIMLLTGRALAESVDPATAFSDGWTARATDGVVLVLDGDGRKIAELEYEKDEFVPDLLIAADFNFDGQDDLAALTRSGTANGYYSVWLWQADGSFERCEAFDEICAPTPNISLRLIESFERNGAAEYRETQHIWQDGQLVLRRARDIVYQDADTVRVTERVQLEGGEQITEKLLKAAEWDRISSAERQAMALAEMLYAEINAAKFVSHAGAAEVDGRRYTICPITIGHEMVCALYFPEEEGASVLIDDAMDGLSDPAWEIGADGVKTERSHP